MTTDRDDRRSRGTDETGSGNPRIRRKYGRASRNTENSALEVRNDAKEPLSRRNEEGERRSRRNEEGEHRSRRNEEGEHRSRRTDDGDYRRSRESENDRRRRHSSRSYDDRDPRYDDRFEEEEDRKKSGCLGCLIPLVILLVILGGLAYMAVGFFWDKVQKPGFDPSDIQINSDLPDSVKNGEDNYESIMLFGVDSRDQDPLKSGALADSNILVTINRSTGEITMTSFYRDLYVETTDGSHMKLTEVYSNYGVKESLQTINRNFDLNVTEFVTVTWLSVADAIDGLGGVDLTITAKEAQAINDYIDETGRNTGLTADHVSEDISGDGETIHLNGVQAVTYCRIRKGVGDDYKRTERQRTVISAAFAKAKRNPVKAAAAANRILPEIASNLTSARLLSLAGGLMKYDMGENYGFPKDKGDDNSYVYPNTLLSNDQWLHETVYGNGEYTPSDTVTGISQRTAEKSGYYG